MLASEILTSARQVLSDTQKLRWTDARLLTLLNDGINILVNDTTLFNEHHYLQLADGVEEYVASRAFKILRAEYMGLPLTPTSHEEMDKLEAGWTTKLGTRFTHILTDKAQPGHFRLYPKLETLPDTLVEHESGPYGIITDISYTDYQLTMTGDEGEIGTPENGWLKLYYSRKLPKYTAITDEVEMDDFLVTPLSSYIAARALRDNQDTQNRSLAAEEMNIFEAVVEKYNVTKSKLYSSGALSTAYVGAFQ